MDSINFTNEEKEEAKQNGFILVGKTGAGKSTLLNAMYGKDIALVVKRLKSVTKTSKVYYYKLENGKCVSLVDTPGLSDTTNNPEKDVDYQHIDNIRAELTKENIHIKGILFLVNFQEERFDASEQEALINYNALFPLRKFWEHVIIIFTHHFLDPDGCESIEELKEQKNQSNKEIFDNIMKRVKEVSDVIDYKNLKLKYCNSYSPARTDTQNEKNKLVKKEMEKEISELCAKPPLFTKIEIIRLKNDKIHENGKYFLCERDYIFYYDLNNKKPIQVKILKEYSKEEISQDSKTKVEAKGGKIISSEKDANNNIVLTEKEATEENSTTMKLIKTGGWVGVGAIIGGLAVGVPGAVAGAGLVLGVSLLKKIF